MFIIQFKDELISLIQIPKNLFWAFIHKKVRSIFKPSLNLKKTQNFDRTLTTGNKCSCYKVSIIALKVALGRIICATLFGSGA